MFSKGVVAPIFWVVPDETARLFMELHYPVRKKGKEKPMQYRRKHYTYICDKVFKNGPSKIC